MSPANQHRQINADMLSLLNRRPPIILIRLVLNCIPQDDLARNHIWMSKWTHVSQGKARHVTDRIVRAPRPVKVSSECWKLPLLTHPCPSSRNRLPTPTYYHRQAAPPQRIGAWEEKQPMDQCEKTSVTPCGTTVRNQPQVRRREPRTESRGGRLRWKAYQSS